MRIVLYGVDRLLAHRALSVLGRQHCRAVWTLREWTLSWRAADVSVLVVGDVTQLTPRLLSGLRGMTPPLVLVAPLDVRLLRRVEGLSDVFAAVVWAAEMEESLVSAVVTAGRSSLQGELEQRLLDLAPRDGVLAQVIHEAVRVHSPSDSVVVLARRLRVSSSSLYHQWSQSPFAGVPLKSFLDWCRLLRAMDLRCREGWKWDAVARHLLVDRRTLQRTAQRLCDTTLGGLSASDVHGRFFAWLQEMLLRDQA